MDRLRMCVAGQCLRLRQGRSLFLDGINVPPHISQKMRRRFAIYNFGYSVHVLYAWVIRNLEKIIALSSSVRSPDGPKQRRWIMSRDAWHATIVEQSGGLFQSMPVWSRCLMWKLRRSIEVTKAFQWAISF